MRYLHDGLYRALLDGLETELAGAVELARFELAVTVVSRLDDGLVARIASPLRIELDAARFERAFEWERRAHVVHETAHAWRGERDCYEADLCVLGWGLGDWFLDARGAMLDSSYRSVLDVAAREGREKAEPLYEAWSTKREVLAKALGHFRT